MTTATLPKAPTGIPGLDELTAGGLPLGRPTLVCGSAGCGKTLLGVQFLVKGIQEYGEPGVFVSFEETGEELAANVASVGWDLSQLQADGVLAVDHIRMSAGEIEEAGSYDLEGLFIRLGAAIDRVGAKRVVVDTIEVLFAMLSDHASVRSELRRLFGWLKERGVTAIITAERGDGSLTRNGLEEYVSDCVILLDHRVTEQVSTRRMRIVKYRGSAHITDESPFTIDEQGFRVLPITSVRLAHEAPDERLSTGVPRLDTMLGGSGYFRGGSILISGTAGSGKTTLAASFVAAGCARGEKALYFAFEESPKQLMRNLHSVGIDLEQPQRDGLLQVLATRPTAVGLETHLAQIMAAVDDFEPRLVVVDPISAFGPERTEREAMLTRLVDLLKVRGMTALFTTLVGSSQDFSGVGVSSVIDAWIRLDAVTNGAERNRALSIVKARGTEHSNQVREFLITSQGLDLIDVYAGGGQVLMGTARTAAEADDVEQARLRSEGEQARLRGFERRETAVRAQIAMLEAELQAEQDELRRQQDASTRAARQRVVDADAIGRARHADEEPTS